jgi:uncharacterized protein YndB with AHSA1/START domain
MSESGRKPGGEAVTLRQSIWIRAEPERVFRALVERAELVHWFATEVDGDLRDGRPVAFTFASCNAVCRGEVLEVVPPRRVVFTFDRSRVTYELEASNGGTLVRLTDEGLPPDVPTVAGQSEGWAAYLCNLKVRIEDGRDLRADQPQGTILPK